MFEFLNREARKSMARQFYENSIKPKIIDFRKCGVTSSEMGIIFSKLSNNRPTPNDIINQIKTGENMNNSDSVKINGGDLFQFVAKLSCNPGFLMGHHLKLSRDKNTLLDLVSGAYWTNATLKQDLILQIRKWLSDGTMRKIPEGVSVSIIQETIEDTEDAPDKQGLIDQLEELSKNIDESYKLHTDAINYLDDQIKNIKDITDS